MDPGFLDRTGFDALLTTLTKRGFQLIGPVERDGTIMLEPISRSADMPRVTDEQGRGRYRLEAADGSRLFPFTNGPDSAKRYLFPAREVIQKISKSDGHLESRTETDGGKYAFIGLRACDLQAIAVQDRTFMGGPGINTQYDRRRQDAFLVGIDCGEPAGNCFCVSMGSGPQCAIAYDIALTEIEGGFVVRAGTEAGEEVMAGLPLRLVTIDQTAEAAAVVEGARDKMGRSLDTSDLPGLLLRNRDNPRWSEVAEICLACGNCTAVCPTCFCHDVTDGVDLLGTEATRTREWASCFSQEFSHLSHVDVRTSGAARYRQWLTHKFSTWFEQFGFSGCVGCGRCITWCPVGIDVTEEIELIRAREAEVAAEVTA